VGTSRPSGSHARLLAGGAAVVLAVLPLPGCTETVTETVSGYEPASLEPVAGAGDVKRVRFTAEGAQRTGLRTASVRRRAGLIVVPYAAVLYEPEGTTFVYTSSAPLTFVREEVGVERIEGDLALLSDGPAAGTEVVTVGATQVHGTELEIAGSH
jgi:hypothetical protein